MKYLGLLVGGLLGLLAGPAFAANYYVASVSVASSTTPVTVLPPGQATTSWVLCLRSTAAVSVLCFPYTGALPGAVPPSAWEIAPAACRGDTASTVDPTMQTGWACALSTSGAAGTLDALGR